MGKIALMKNYIQTSSCYELGGCSGTSFGIPCYRMFVQSAWLKLNMAHVCAPGRFVMHSGCFVVAVCMVDSPILPFLDEYF